MNEVVTWSMIRSKIPSFPAPTSGRENECLTKNEILSMCDGMIAINGNYNNSECVMIEDIVSFIPQGMTLGYLDSNDNAIPVMRLVDGGSYDANWFKEVVGDNISIIILNGFYDRYNHSYADATELVVTASVKMGGYDFKIPTNPNGINGSCIFTPARKIREGVFYVGTVWPANLPYPSTQHYNINIDGTFEGDTILYPLLFTYTMTV